jgi:hypothetical protein
LINFSLLWESRYHKWRFRWCPKYWHHLNNFILRMQFQVYKYWGYENNNIRWYSVSDMLYSPKDISTDKKKHRWHYIRFFCRWYIKFTDGDIDEMKQVNFFNALCLLANLSIYLLSMDSPTYYKIFNKSFFDWLFLSKGLNLSLEC